MKVLSVLLAFQFALSEPTMAAIFDCERLLRQVSTLHSTLAEDFATVDAKFGGRKVDLEDALTAVAALLENERNQFTKDVTERLKEAPVLDERQHDYLPRFRSQSGVRFEPRIFPSDRGGQVAVLFDAIRAAFSRDTVDRKQWMQASPQDRLRLILHFRTQAVKVLYYQYRLFQKFKSFMGEHEGPNLSSESELPIQRPILPLRIFTPRGGDVLFYEVRLTRELEAHISRLDDAEKSGQKLYDVLMQYVDQTFVDNLDSIFNTGPALVRFETISIAALVGGGLLVAYFGGPWIPPHYDSGPNVQPAPAALQLEKKEVLNPVDQALFELEEIAKTRPLSEGERLIQEELKRLRVGLR